MGKAGYCAECGTNVWLREDGACQKGHAASGISDAYETDTPLVPLAAATPSSSLPVNPKGRRLLIAGLVAVIILIVGLCVLIGVLAKPLVGKGAAVASEWRGRLEKDYPGWRQVSFNTQTSSGAGGNATNWTFGLVPPGREFSVGVVYRSKAGGAPVVQDEVLRPAGTFNSRADSLLGFLESTYVTQNRNIVSVTSDSTGEVTVNWLKVTQLGPVSTRIGSFDHLIYDEGTRSWRVSSSE